MEDYTGVNLDVMWTPKDNYNDKLNLILAGGGEDMPQIIATETKSPAIINAAKAGALWDIEELLQEFPHLKNSKAVVMIISVLMENFMEFIVDVHWDGTV